MDKIEKYKGCFCGLAVGDAVGTTLEFNSPGSFIPIHDMVGGGPFHLKPGQWTDDTSMALCLAESLIESNGFNLVDQLERYTQWYLNGHLSSTGKCFDIGNTVREALSNFSVTREPYSGPTHKWAAGNGSIMRLAPVPLFYAQNPQQAIEKSGESSRTTHGNRVAIDACRYLGGLLVGAINGIPKEQLLSEYYRPVGGNWQSNELSIEISTIASGSFKHREPPEIKGTGYVVESLEAALWAFNKSDNYQEGCLMAVNLGDDADTTGAVYGQLAGAYYGVRNIPDKWLEKLFYRELIEDYAVKIFNLSEKIAQR